VREQVAAKYGVPERKPRQFAKVERTAPDLAARVTAGEVPLARAAREVEPAQRWKELAEKAERAEYTVGLMR
jgi:hypothetical protein